MNNDGNKLTTKYEVLAPAGSYECMVAAFNAGADAVYLGGNLFGARAYANNFDTDELIRAIDYAHIHEKKLFLTVNTLLKNTEMNQQLYEYIQPLYEAGLDAVIVQDYGVLSFIKEKFPELDIHASTQMTVTGPSFAKKLKEYGVTRIVPARELSIGEIKEIYKETGLEIECFVHGALCYSYSGQCLLSSLIGGRSGNRGRCAQPCRLPYDVQFDNRIIKKEYPLSPKDLCTLQILPEILEAGVYSLKIEGRMKKPEYVAIVTSMYRKYVDMYMEKGKSGYKINPDDIEQLKDIYNRGGFTDGYYKQYNGKDIMSTNRPNHMGTPVANIKSVDENKKIIKAVAMKDIDKDDVLEIFIDNNRSVYLKPVSVKKDAVLLIDSASVSIKPGEKINIKQIFRDINSNKVKYIMRTRNNKLIKDIQTRYLGESNDTPIIIEGSIVARKNMPITFDIRHKDKSIYIEGSIPQKATNRPISEDEIRKQLFKTGGTGFAFSDEKFSITMEDGLFINIKELNALRRQALDTLRQEILLDYRRKVPGLSCETDEKKYDEQNIVNCNEAECSNIDHTIVTALVSSIEQFKVVVEDEKIDFIYVESDIFSNANSVQNEDEFDWNKVIDLCHRNNKEIFMALPYITRGHAQKKIIKNQAFFKTNQLDGYVFRNLETLFLFESLGVNVKKMIFDNTIYGVNDYGINFLKKYEPFLITASYELNNKELAGLTKYNTELCVYGKIPVMTSAGCVKKTYGKCDRQMSETILRDRLGNEFSVINHCDYCYNITYNSKPLMLYDIVKEKILIKPKAVRYNFVTENALQTKHILEKNISKDFTRGHFKRGVE